MKLENFKNGYDVTVGSSLALNEKNDCAVRAIANAFNITYDNAHAFTAEKFKRKTKKGTKGFFVTLSQLGFATFDLFQDSLFPETKTYSIHPIARNNKRIGIVNTDYTHKVVNHTVKTFCAKFNKGTYILTVAKHALTIKDGIVIDNPDMQFTGYRRIVESACEIK
tara:strand:+ start:272 stop:769 length:498 start_codon:yes stop_codon:yes gene_type:complete